MTAADCSFLATQFGASLSFRDTSNISHMAPLGAGYSFSACSTSSPTLVAPVQPTPAATGPPTMPQVTSSQQPARIPETRSLDDALRYWESGAPERGLMVPLKLWASTYSTSDYASQAVKLGHIRFVQHEFYVICEGDYGLFESRFPGLRYKYTKLIKAVANARKDRGEAKS